MLAGVAFRVALAHFRPVGDVEAFSWRLATDPLRDLLEHTAVDCHPPLYYIALKLWIAAFGSSALGMRALSVLFGGLASVMAYVLCKEVRVAFGPGGAISNISGGAMFAAFLVSTHIAQVEAGRLARMYAMGAFLALLTAWLLLRAIRGTDLAWLWWTLYGLAVAAFWYTHYYGFFTVAAQGVFLLVDAGNAGRRGKARQGLRLLKGYVWALTVAVTLFMPWLPVFRDQADAVRRSYWIPQLNVNTVIPMFLRWATGQHTLSSAVSWLWMAILGTTAIWILSRDRRTALFVLLQAGIPWLAAFLVSVMSKRPIIVDRYLVFANLGLLTYWGVLWPTLPGRATRIAVACFVGGLCLYGTWLNEWCVPIEKSAIADVSKYLSAQYRPRDVVILPDAMTLNHLRYDAFQEGLHQVAMRCPIGDRESIHYMHTAALDESDVLDPTFAKVPQATRVWRLTNGSETGMEPPPGMTLMQLQWFSGDVTYCLALFERRPAALK